MFFHIYIYIHIYVYIYIRIYILSYPVQKADLVANKLNARARILNFYILVERELISEIHPRENRNISRPSLIIG